MKNKATLSVCQETEKDRKDLKNCQKNSEVVILGYGLMRCTQINPILRILGFREKYAYKSFYQNNSGRRK